MKRNLLTLFVLLLGTLPLSMMGQVTITNSIFPVPGDTLRTVTSFNFSGFDKEQTGEGVAWDLSNANGGILTETIFAEPSEGMASDLFPDADLLNNSTIQEIYYETFNNKIVEIGRSGLDPVLNLIDLTFENDGELVLRRAPMSLGDAFTDESSFFITSSADVLPDTLLGDLASAVDSLRLLVETTNEDIVDGWGTAELPNGENYDVIRVKRTTTTNAVLGAKILILGWVDVDANNPLFAPLGELLDLLGESTTVSYNFFANDNKEIIASYAEDPDGNLISYTYKGNMTTSDVTVDLKDVDILTYPNPTYGNITFQLVNQPLDDYKVVVYNILGKQMWSSDINYFDGKLNADLSFLSKGTYFYSIMNGTGQKVATRRLMIMTP